jgi:hypothetical protein
MKFNSRKEAASELTRRGFKFDHRSLGREYWIRTDGQKDIFLDHSATVTKIGREFLITDFVERRKLVG